KHKRPLDPVLVTTIGGKLYVIDGHHRVDAYHTVKWNRPEPVEHFEGTLKEARVEAFKRNSKNKLSMTRDDKLEGAWRLVKEGEETQTQIADITTVSVRTIAMMIKVRDQRKAQQLAKQILKSRRLRRRRPRSSK